MKESLSEKNVSIDARSPGPPKVPARRRHALAGFTAQECCVIGATQLLFHAVKAISLIRQDSDFLTFYASAFRARLGESMYLRRPESQSATLPRAGVAPDISAACRGVARMDCSVNTRRSRCCTVDHACVQRGSDPAGPVDGCRVSPQRRRDTSDSASWTGFLDRRRPGDRRVDRRKR